MMKQVVIVMPPHKFRDEELFDTKRVLEEAGIAVEVVSTTLEEVTGMFGGKIKPDRLINDVEVRNIDALLLVGGAGTVGLFKHEMILQMVKRAKDYDKVIGAICVAPTILANAHVIEGKRVTSFPSEKQVIESKGAKYTGRPIEQDGKIVTARGPEYAESFAKKVIEVLTLIQ